MPSKVLLWPRWAGGGGGAELQRGLLPKPNSAKVLKRNHCSHAVILSEESTTAEPVHDEEEPSNEEEEEQAEQAEPDEAIPDQGDNEDAVRYGTTDHKVGLVFFFYMT